MLFSAHHQSPVWSPHSCTCLLPHPLVIKCFLWPPTVQVSPVWWPMRTGLHHTGVGLEGGKEKLDLKAPLRLSLTPRPSWPPSSYLSRSILQMSIWAIWIKIREMGAEQSELSTLVQECLGLLIAQSLEASPGSSMEKERVNNSLIWQPRINGSSQADVALDVRRHPHMITFAPPFPVNKGTFRWRWL